MTPLLSWQDYYATGQPDVALAFTEQLHDDTMLAFVDATGVINTSSHAMRHIIDWEPAAGSDRFTQSSHYSVDNFYAVRGLDMLAQMLEAGGRSDNASAIAAESAALMARMRALMWNGTAWCDGICSEVGGKSLVSSNTFALALGLVPAADVASAWQTVADWGINEIGTFGAFFAQAALTSSYYAFHYDTPDDGTAIVTALTKCDFFSWCSGLRDDNLTMTREAWHSGTYSHGWSTSPIVGTVWGVLGIHQTAPAWSAFTIIPKLGSLTRASGTVPTLRGFINVSATPTSLDVHVPCSTSATLCTPRAAGVAARVDASTRLFVDNAPVAFVERAGHLCTVEPVGCGAGGAPRRLRAHGA